MTLYERDGEDINQGLVGFWKLDDLKRVAVDGIIAHYKMNDNAASTDVIDSKGGNTGTASVNTSGLTAAGKVNEALLLDGSTDYVTIDSIDEINFDTNENFTIAFWMKAPLTQTDTSGDSNAIISKWNASGDAYPYVLRIQNQTDASPGVLEFKRYDLTNNPTAASSTLLNDNVLHHIFMMKDGNDIKIFVDNTLEDTETDTTTATTKTSADVTLSRRGNGDIPCDVTIDEVRFYNRALSSGERASVFNSGTGTETTELFRETIVAIDRSNFNDGTITGATNTTGINGLNADAMFFDGVDDKVAVTHNVLLAKGSVALWFNKRGDTSDPGGVASMFQLDKHERTRIIATDAGSVSVLKGDPGAQQSIGSVNDDEQHHAIICWEETDATTGNFWGYLDGVKSAINTFSHTQQSHANSIFGALGTDNEVFNGDIQNIRMYNRILTDGEASKLHRLKL